MLKKLFSDTIVYAFIPQLPKLVSFFILPILTKDLTDFDYGISGIIAAYIGGLAALKTLGLEDIFINYYYKHPKLYKKIWAHLFGFLSFYMIFFIIIIAVILFFTLPIPVYKRLLIIVLNTASLLFFSVTNMFGGRYLQLKQKPVPVATISAVSGITVVFLNLLTISYFKLGYLGWFISSFIAALIQFVYYSHIVFFKIKLSPVFKFRYKYIKKYLKISTPLIPNKYGHFLLNSSDRIVMDILKFSVKKLGLYNFGYNLGNYFQIIVSSVGLAIGPFYLQLLKINSKDSFLNAKKITFVVQASVLIMTTLASLWMKQVFDILVSNETLRTSYDIAIIIVMTQNYAPFRFYFTNLVVYNEKTSFLWKITFIGGIINVVLNFIFLKIFGIRVAAVTTFLSLFYITVAGFYFPQYKKIKKTKMYPLLLFFITLVILLLVYLFRDIAVVYKIILSVIIIVFSFIVFIKLKKSKFFNSLQKITNSR